MALKPNRLIKETSPYLLQHAHNPVDWYPWGEEALARAASEDKPILLSIGYAACHWCHVMERESFENVETAALMNSNFVCIKVDREERPDIDSIYMDAVQAMTHRGGWPMTMFLTPDGTPFYGGSYFPPSDSHGLPGFIRVLEAVIDSWRTQRTQLIQQGKELIDSIQFQTTPHPSQEPLTNSLMTHAVTHVSTSFDEANGGFGDAPKFPQAPFLEFLLRAAAADLGNSRHMVNTTLTAMAKGGIYDQIGGGFSRYSVDDRWIVPHFEKMLYDNAQLARLYTRAWQLFKTPIYKRIAVETLEYLMRDMRDQGGGFYSSEDADSEGTEGKFYIWNHEEFNKIAPDAAGFFGVGPEGNFERSNILIATGDEPPADARRALFTERTKRVRPARDEKIITSWNGLVISALAEAGAAFQRDDFLDAARAAARSVNELHVIGNRLQHVFTNGRAKVKGMLEDYAFLADGLFTLWEATFEPEWIVKCEDLTEQMLSLFWDEKEGGFFSTGTDHEKLIMRQKEIPESATPSGNGVAVMLLQKLAVLTGYVAHTDQAVEILRLSHIYMAKAPQAAGSFLSALDFWQSTPTEVVIIGDPADSGRKALTETVWARFIPNKVMAGGPPGVDSPMLIDKEQLAGAATAFVCERYVCKSPTTDPSELAAQLG